MNQLQEPILGQGAARVAVEAQDRAGTLQQEPLTQHSVTHLGTSQEFAPDRDTWTQVSRLLDHRDMVHTGGSRETETP